MNMNTNMNSPKEKKLIEIQAKEFIEKITDLEFENSLLSQKNKLLEKKLESLTSKYNDLKKELFDIEEHIIFCKDNLIQLVNYNINNNNQKAISPENFYAFKNKINTLFEYDNDFLNTDSEITVFNMIIDNITNIKNENLSLKKTLEDLKKIIDEKNNNNYNLNNNININNNISNISPNYENLPDSDMNSNLEQNSGYGYSYNYNSKYDDIDKRRMNSKMYLNNLMNNIDNLQNVFKTDNDFDLYKTTSNNYSSSFSKPHKYHKYI